MKIEEARALMEGWTESPALRVHMEAVALCMGAYAQKLEPDHEERYVVTGLLHDFDYEKHPSTDEHPFVGVEHLRSLGVEEEITEAILGHAYAVAIPLGIIPSRHPQRKRLPVVADQIHRVAGENRFAGAGDMGEVLERGVRFP